MSRLKFFSLAIISGALITLADNWLDISQSLGWQKWRLAHILLAGLLAFVSCRAYWQHVRAQEDNQKLFKN